MGYNQNGVKIHNATSTSSYGSSYTVGDTIGVAMNLDTGELEYYKNGVSQGVAFTDLEGNLTACHADTGSAAGFNYNFGQKPFKFAPPDGFQPLTTANTRPVKVISRPDQYVGVTTWSGNGVSQNIIGLKHKPDFVWIKKELVELRDLINYLIVLEECMRLCIQMAPMLKIQILIV